MGFHAGDKDSIIGTDRALGCLLIRLKIIGINSQMPAEDIHGLDIEMIMDRDFTTWAHSKESETVFRGIFRPGLAQPSDPHLIHLQWFTLIGKTFDFSFVFIAYVYDIHDFFLSLLMPGKGPQFTPVPSGFCNYAIFKIDKENHFFMWLIVPDLNCISALFLIPLA